MMIIYTCKEQWPRYFLVSSLNYFFEQLTHDTGVDERIYYIQYSLKSYNVVSQQAATISSNYWMQLDQFDVLLDHNCIEKY